MPTPSSASPILLLLLTTLISTLPPPPSAHSFGGATTIAIISTPSTTTTTTTTTICSIVASQPTQQIQCFKPNQTTPIPISPSISFDFISGGVDFFCGVRSGGAAVICWDINFTPKRIYFNVTSPIKDLTIGGSQVCALTSLNDVVCLRGGSYFGVGPFRTVSSGLGFSCGVVERNKSVVCWGINNIYGNMGLKTESLFRNISMESVVVGGGHACGISSFGVVICEGDNDNGQLNVPSNSSYEFSGLALGANHSCGIRRVDRSVICWGGNGEFSSDSTNGVSFESIVAGFDFTCGLTSVNLSIICWGPGWPNGLYPAGVALPLGKILPGPCLQENCECGVYPQSQELCFGDGNICRPCDVPIMPSPPPPFQPPPSSPSRGLRRGLLAFAIIGSVGAFLGICSIIYFLWTGVCFGKKKIHNSVQPTITVLNNSNSKHSSSSPTIFSRSSTLVRQGSRLMRRQRSGTSSKHTDRAAEEFLFSDLYAATNDFSLENKIGAGSFGIVYKGKLPDGREVAIKRGEIGAKLKKLQEKESAFESELAFLSRLHHKHLVGLVGYCEERDERLLVYDYMKNGALYDHLHDKNNVEKDCSLVNSWKMRIKIALDASRGIEYLHNYAVPPIIHRDIKSSNILLDATWTARVSDFGLSLLSPQNDEVEFKPQKAAGTVGYIDPEYYALNVLTPKSDVYGFGVVLLELLTGKKAIFKSVETGSSPIALVDYAVPVIKLGEVETILDRRVGPPLDSGEAEAVELVAYMAMHCVNSQGKDRPTMTDIVANLERADALCNYSRSDSISSIVSE
ncbi:non-receptor serine/threonine protein kinase [Lithospermum erythrorhizon]|uniref:non-specific serine/threonine protein kinase n=1 Tax=Lithospermum erythrorhizon TaxID=34254 RepID=A0AAV3NH20_LITER